MTAVRSDAAHVAAEIAEALSALSLAPRAAVVNRAVPEALADELAALPAGAIPAEAAGVVRYARAYVAVQRRVIDAVAPLAPRVVVVPSLRGLAEGGRLDALATLGERLRRGIA